MRAVALKLVLVVSTLIAMIGCAFLGAAARELFLPISKNSSGAYGVEFMVLLFSAGAALAVVIAYPLLRHAVRKLELSRAKSRVAYALPVVAFILAGIFFR